MYYLLMRFTRNTFFVFGAFLALGLTTIGRRVDMLVLLDCTASLKLLVSSRFFFNRKSAARAINTNIVSILLFPLSYLSMEQLYYTIGRFKLKSLRQTILRLRMCDALILVIFYITCSCSKLYAVSYLTATTCKKFLYSWLCFASK